MRTPIYEYKSVKVDSGIVSNTIKAGGQTRFGTKFNPPSGGFSWDSRGNNVSISVSIGYGPLSLSVSSGTANPNGSGGLWQASPYIGEYCHLYIKRDIEVNTYGIYRKVVMASNPTWEFVEYEQTGLIVGEELVIKKSGY